jgi:hypothetical protein
MRDISFEARRPVGGEKKKMKLCSKFEEDFGELEVDKTRHNITQRTVYSGVFMKDKAIFIALSKSNSDVREIYHHRLQIRFQRITHKPYI